jgi:translocation and assembly module TamB
LNKRKGSFKADASKLHLEHEYVDLDSEVHLTTVLDGNKTSVNGNIVLLDGHVHYDLRQKTFATDDDIIIVQDMKKNQESAFMDNLSVSVKIETKKPLVYKQKDIDIKADVHLGIYKTEYAPLMVLGSIELPKGGTYIFRDKAFVLNKSYIYFTGDFNKPILDVSFTHKSLDHLITATVTGSLAVPNINFSSIPSLTREEILSVILFDSKAGAGTNSGEEMMKMMGGAMAKSVLSNLGLQLDHLVLGEGNSVEVGKKLTEDITIIYVKDETPIVKLKYEHGKRTESVISVSEESQSYDIIYKRDF